MPCATARAPYAGARVRASLATATFPFGHATFPAAHVTVDAPHVSFPWAAIVYASAHLRYATAHVIETAQTMPSPSLTRQIALLTSWPTLLTFRFASAHVAFAPPEATFARAHDACARIAASYTRLGVESELWPISRFRLFPPRPGTALLRPPTYMCFCARGVSVRASARLEGRALTMGMRAELSPMVLTSLLAVGEVV